MGVLALALEAIFQQPLCLLALGSVVASWLVWRLWRFSIEPLLKRDEPQELPYCIPCKQLLKGLLTFEALANLRLQSLVPWPRFSLLATPQNV